MEAVIASKARIPPETFNRVAYQGARVRVDRRGGKPVFIVSEEDLNLLERLENRYWSDEGARALEEFERSGEKSIPFAELRAQLGL